MRLPQSNATLRAVARPGTAEDYDHAASAGPAKWSGEVRAYVAERSQRVEGLTSGSVSRTASEASSVIVARSVIVPASLAVDWSQGDVLEFERDGKKPVKVAVQAIERHEQPGVPGTVRLTLEEA